VLYINFRFSNFGTLNPRPTHAQMAVLETQKRFTKLRPTPVQPPAGSVQKMTPAAGSLAEVCQDLVAQSGLPSIVAADLAIAWLHVMNRHVVDNRCRAGRCGLMAEKQGGNAPLS
jgi:hypothetical protein